MNYTVNIDRMCNRTNKKLLKTNKERCRSIALSTVISELMLCLWTKLRSADQMSQVTCDSGDVTGIDGTVIVTVCI